jgi:maleylpyruvate isomerase
VTDPRPTADLRRVTDAQQRFDAAIAELHDDEVRRASRLPGWTAAHVLTHVARNADSHRRRADAARRAEVIDQYPGGFTGRAAEIDGGAARGARELLADVRSSATAMEEAWGSVPAEAWDAVSRDVSGTERPLRALPARRWQELEIHVVDLDVGVTHRDWSDDFVTHLLATLRSTVTARLPAGADVPAPGVLDDRDELAWLTGRLHRADLPDLAPWG